MSGENLGRDMVIANTKAMDEAQIYTLLELRVKAIRTRDLNGVMSGFAPEILSFDVINPLQTVGVEAAKKRAEEWTASFQGRVGFEIWDLSIMTGTDVAYSHSLNRINGTTAAGNKIDMYWRATVCYRKLEGRWLITHEHNSVPFDPKTGRASLDLKP